MAGSISTNVTVWPVSSIARGVTAVFPPPGGRELVEVVHQAPEVFGIERSRWRLCDLRGVVPWLRGYTLAGISRALSRLGVRRKRGRLSIHSPDLAYQKKLSWVEGARAFSEREPERASLVYGDEFTLFRQPSLAPVYAARGVEPKALLSHKSNTRYRISAALDAVSGRVTWTAGSKMGVKGLRRFLGELREAYPGRRLFLVWDNWPIHQHPAVLAEAAELEIEILWLPTYAPWTNPIEKLWRWVRQEVVHHHRLADRWEELKARVAAFLERFVVGSTELLRYVGLLPD